MSKSGIERSHAKITVNCFSGLSHTVLKLLFAILLYRLSSNKYAVTRRLQFWMGNFWYVFVSCVCRNLLNFMLCYVARSIKPLSSHGTAVRRTLRSLCAWKVAQYWDNIRSSRVNRLCVEIMLYGLWSDRWNPADPDNTSVSSVSRRVRTDDKKIDRHRVRRKSLSRDSSASTCCDCLWWKLKNCSVYKKRSVRALAHVK